MPGVAATTVLCFFFSLPQHFQVNQAIRNFGQATEYRIGDYERSYEQAVGGGWTLSALLPGDYRLQYPQQPWGADPLSWIYYATRKKPSDADINYIIQQASDSSPDGSSLVESRDGISVYVRDIEVWQNDRDLLSSISGHKIRRTPGGYV